MQAISIMFDESFCHQDDFNCLDNIESYEFFEVLNLADLGYDSQNLQKNTQVNLSNVPFSSLVSSIKNAAKIKVV